MNLEQKLVAYNLRPHPKFGMAPFVLRRSDILRFWDTPDIERQLVFWDYFRSSDNEDWSSSVTEQLKGLEQERVDAKQRRRDIAKRIAVRMDIDVEEVPIDPGAFQDFVRNRFYGGFNKKQRKQAERRGIKFRIPQRLDELIQEMRKASEVVRSLNGEISRLRLPTTSQPKGERLKQMDAVLTKVSERLTDSFCSISTSRTFVDRIRLSWGDVSQVSLSLDVSLKNGKYSPPTGVFSEANLDLLALLVFLAVAKESEVRGHAPLLVLDDVFQSVDSTVRLNVVEYILSEFADWQLIFTVHDRLWHEQLRILMRRHSKVFVDREIVRWDFANGPVLTSVSRDMDVLLREALDRGEVYMICAQAGLLLERICNTLSYNLPISVTRRREDKYTLGDLWPGVYKVLKKTSISDVAAEVDRWLHLRNLVGGHFNEWAVSLSRQEAQFFGDSVLNLLEQVQCPACHRWIEESSSNGADRVWQCRCGTTRVERTSSN